MRSIDADRSAYAHEHAGYRSTQTSLAPINCSPKNQIILGLPPSPSAWCGVPLWSEDAEEKEE